MISHESQQSMSYQATVRLSILPCIKDQQSNPVWGVESQNPDKELTIIPVLTVRGPISGPSYMVILTFGEI